MPITKLKQDYISVDMGQNKRMHEKQIANLLALSENERYDFFIRYCADFEKVWGLAVNEDEWVIFKDSEGDEIFPLWPHKNLAEACCFEEHKQMGARPQSISLKVFLDECIPDMALQHVLIGVFFDNTRKGVAVVPEELKHALQEELETTWE